MSGVGVTFHRDLAEWLREVAGSLDHVEVRATRLDEFRGEPAPAGGWPRVVYHDDLTAVGRRGGVDRLDLRALTRTLDEVGSSTYSVYFSISAQGEPPRASLGQPVDRLATAVNLARIAVAVRRPVLVENLARVQDRWEVAEGVMWEALADESRCALVLGVDAMLRSGPVSEAEDFEGVLAALEGYPRRHLRRLRVGDVGDGDSAAARLARWALEGAPQVTGVTLTLEEPSVDPGRMEAALAAARTVARG